VRFTFRAKLTVVVAIAATAFLLLLATGRWIGSRVNQQLITIQDRYLPKVELEPELEAQFERMQRSFQDAVASHEVDGLSEADDLERVFLERLAAARDAVDPPAAAELRAALDDYYAAAQDVSRRLIANETGEPIVDAMAAMQAKQATFADVLKRTTTFDRRRLTEAFEAATHAEATAWEYQFWIIVACMVSVTSLSAWLSRSVLGSVAALAAGFRRFGDGAFDSPIPVMSRDEIGDLARRANEMAASLERRSEERAKAERKFRTLLESAPDAMVIMGLDGRIVLVNARTERLFGYSRNELLGETVEILVPDRFHDTNVKHRTEYLSEPTERLGLPGKELYGRGKGGGEFPIEITLGPLETEEGPLVSASIRDVTDRKRTEDALLRSNRELEAFSYSVAHDLRAPLRGISGFSSALLDDWGDRLDGEAKDYLNRIMAGAVRMGQLIDALLSLSRLSRADVRREAVNLSRLAAEVVKQLRANHPGRVIEFVNDQEVVAEGDAGLLVALLENLIGNAWKFTANQPAATIHFGSEHKDGDVVYYVRDNGAGFEMAYKDKLFAPFQRLHRADQFAGTGIGLATVERIVNRHGGRVWAHSEVGQGATFYFTLANFAGGAS
jgi:PAS domain S-box-containing protein